MVMFEPFELVRAALSPPLEQVIFSKSSVFDLYQFDTDRKRNFSFLSNSKSCVFDTYSFLYVAKTQLFVFVKFEKVRFRSVSVLIRIENTLFDFHIFSKCYFSRTHLCSNSMTMSIWSAASSMTEPYSQSSSS